LSRHVEGTPLLKRRLLQIGLVDAVDGPALMPALKPGQRLVTLEGALWRWDGFVSAADAPTAAAQRLAQRNRLADLDEELAHARGERNALKRQVDALVAGVEAAREAERVRRQAWRSAQHAIGTAQAELEQELRAAGELSTRRAALDEARTRLVGGIAEAQEAIAAAQASLSEIGMDADASVVDEAQGQLVLLRQRADQARMALNTLESSARVRAARIDQLSRDQAGWQKRHQSALVQVQTLDQRLNDVRTQIEAMNEAPEGQANRAAQLEERIEQAREEHKQARDRLAEAQGRWRDAEKALKTAVDSLNAVQIELTRMEERLKGIIAQRQQIERQTEETLGIPASRTLEASGIRPEQALPAEGAVEQKLDRLKAERERLGGVNLTAEREAEEVQARLDTMIKDRDDIIEAVAKLRASIVALNREGRGRLNAAFSEVNAHFQDLFTTLFGGGTAELTFVESDDPLEAGLEVVARPPGKKPQTMTLLSGGEQALTAMSLIFAVFLTNPAPICVLDEVDAPLDDANVERFCNLLDSMRARTQTRFMVITHNPITMSRMDRLFGVTMAERGVSQLVSVDLRTAESFREAG
jgi:chromosome segregation protein